MIAGTAYGVVLNDRDEVAALGPAFTEPPYKAAPVAPVLYVKPRPCLTGGGAPVPVPAGLQRVEVAATLALLFGRDVAGGGTREAADAIAAVCLALDVSEPHRDYYRPAVRQRCRDGFLPLGRFAAPIDGPPPEIVTRINGAVAHRWSLDRLLRPIAALVAEITAFMTLGAGDLLLVGLPGDAPQAGIGDAVEVSAGGLPPLTTTLVAEAWA